MVAWSSETRQLLRSLLCSTGYIAGGLSAFYCLNKYGVFMSRVTGPSMFPTFKGHNDLVLVEAVSPLLDRVTVGDVVICVRPVDPREHIIKRVAAVAGQEVVLWPDKDHADIRHLTVPPGHVWLQGDNMLHSLDSRQYGPVPLALVRGRVFCQLWPEPRVSFAKA